LGLSAVFTHAGDVIHSSKRTYGSLPPLHTVFIHDAHPSRTNGSSHVRCDVCRRFIFASPRLPLHCPCIALAFEFSASRNWTRADTYSELPGVRKCNSSLSVQGLIRN